MTVNDELIQSYIFRRLEISGCGDMHCIINGSGLWHSYPVIPKSIRELFIHDSDSFLFSLFEYKIPINEILTPFSNPLNLYNHFFRLFPKESVNGSGNGIPIAFCPECIRDSIKKLGFSYFKRIWLKNVHCDIHHTKLLKIPRASYHATLTEIRKIMLGKTVQYSDFPSMGEYKKGKYYLNIETHVYKSDMNFPAFYIMPCLSDVFHALIEEIVIFRGSFPGFQSDFADEIIEEVIRFRWRTRYAVPNDGELYKLYLKIMLSFPEIIDKHVMQNAEQGVFNYGARNGFSFSVRTFKLKYKNCSLCSKDNLNCVYSKRIF